MINIANKLKKNKKFLVFGCGFSGDFFAKTIRKKGYMKGKLGMIIDGTGHNVEKIEKQKRELGLAGYDTYMVFVNTTLDVALERNSKRSRVLPEKIVTQSWNDVQKNIGRFQQMFGRDFVVVDNSDTLDEKQAAKKFGLYVKKYADKWANSKTQFTYFKYRKTQ